MPAGHDIPATSGVSGCLYDAEAQNLIENDFAQSHEVTSEQYHT